MAQVVLERELRAAGLDVEVDSAAVTSYEVGNPMDRRAASILRRQGYELPDRVAREVTPDDFVDFDLILPMTRSHLRDLERFARRWGVSDQAELRLFRTFADADLDEGEEQVDVPDPWYGTDRDFVETLQIIEDATPAIAEHVRDSQ